MRLLLELRERNDEIARCVNATFFLHCGRNKLERLSMENLFGEILLFVSESHLGCKDAFLPEKTTLRTNTSAYSTLCR